MGLEVVVKGVRLVSSPSFLTLSLFIAFLPSLSSLFGFDSGQMVKLCEPDREFY